MYYTEVLDYKPRNLINYCFKCRILELRNEGSRSFRKLDRKHHDVFDTYLAKRKSSRESQVRDILKGAGFDFKLETPTYLVHKYLGDTISKDAIDGFASGRYNSETQFSVIRLGGKIHNHSLSGSHMVGKMKIFDPGDLGDLLLSIMHDIDLSRYGEDLIECVSSCTSDSGKLFCRALLDLKIEYPFPTLCNIAATDSKKFIEILSDCDYTFGAYPHTRRRNTEIASNYSHINPDHQRLGLNLMDILVLLNPNTKIDVYGLMGKMHKWDPDLRILLRSLRYWLTNVQSEREYELIKSHIKCLEKDYTIELFD